MKKRVRVRALGAVVKGEPKFYLGAYPGLNTCDPNIRPGQSYFFARGRFNPLRIVCKVIDSDDGPKVRSFIPHGQQMDREWLHKVTEPIRIIV